MRSRSTALVLGLLALAGCNDGGPAGPGIPDSLMVEALVEIHLADARAAHSGEDRDSLRARALDAHGLDTTDLARALDYFAEHPEDYQPIYDLVLDQIIREQRGW